MLILRGDMFVEFQNLIGMVTERLECISRLLGRKMSVESKECA